MYFKLQISAATGETIGTIRIIRSPRLDILWLHYLVCDALQDNTLFFTF